MRTVRAVALAVALVLTVPLVARAEAGVKVGPGRQLVEPGQTSATIYVANTGDRVARVRMKPYALDAGTWKETQGIGMFFRPWRFKLKPNETLEVTVIIPDTDELCSLMGAGAMTRVRTDNQGVTARGVAIAQLAVNGQGGTEQDCLAILPTPAPAVSTEAESMDPTKYAWLPLAVAGGGVLWLLYSAGRRRERRRYDKRDRSKGFI